MSDEMPKRDVPRQSAAWALVATHDSSVTVAKSSPRGPSGARSCAVVQRVGSSLVVICVRGGSAAMVSRVGDRGRSVVKPHALLVSAVGRRGRGCGLAEVTVTRAHVQLLEHVVGALVAFWSALADFAEFGSFRSPNTIASVGHACWQAVDRRRRRRTVRRPSSGSPCDGDRSSRSILRPVMMRWCRRCTSPSRRACAR